jgi:taurine dioxygenase
MEVRKLGAAMGAEIAGVDLTRLDDATFEKIHAAFLDHHVIVVRDQRLTPPAQIAFSQRFGALEDQLNSHYTVPDYP